MGSSKKKITIVAVLGLAAALVYVVLPQKETMISSESLSLTAAQSDSRAAKSVARHAASMALPKILDATSDQRQTLAAYAELRHKTVLSAAGKVEKSRLLRNRAFLKSLAPLVTASTANDNLSGDVQNNALDLLYDALNGEARATAADVLAQVVRDDQVENKDLPLKDRENLAGIKAEVLYEWTARDAGAAPRIAAMLPGKVSQQLWQTVQERQLRSLASSGESPDTAEKSK